MSAEEYCMLWIAARIEAENAVRAKSVIFTRATGTPRLRAAFGDPPTPVIQLPNFRRDSTYAPTAAISTHHSTDTYRSDVARSNLNDSFQLKILASGSAAIRSGGIEMYVMFVTLEVSTDDRP